MAPQKNLLAWLVAGDIITILVVTMIGFTTHQEAILSWRVLITFLPMVIAWIAIAPWLGVYQESTAAKIRNVWRVVLAVILAAPLAAILRGAWLNAAVLPLFAGVLAATGGLGLSIWRMIWVFLYRRISQHG